MRSHRTCSTFERDDGTPGVHMPRPSSASVASSVHPSGRFSLPDDRRRAVYEAPPRGPCNGALPRAGERVCERLHGSRLAQGSEARADLF